MEIQVKLIQLIQLIQKIIFFLIIFCISLVINCTNNTKPQEITILAAASLADVLSEIEKSYESKTGIDLLISYGGSQILAHQIVHGAKTDLFIPAGHAPLTILKNADMIENSYPLLTNSLILVTHTSNTSSINNLSDLTNQKFNKISIADPNFAPAGIYAKTALSNHGIWENLQEKMILGVNVRTVLSYVETQNVQVGIVYKTDAILNNNVRSLRVIPQESYPKIQYPIAITKMAINNKHVSLFIEYLFSLEASNKFLKYGFETVN